MSRVQGAVSPLFKLLHAIITEDKLLLYELSQLDTMLTVKIERTLSYSDQKARRTWQTCFILIWH